MSSRFGQAEKRPPTSVKIAGIIAAVGLLILFLIAMAATAQRVDASELCVVKRNGQQAGIAEPGFHTKIPIITRFECMEMRTQALEFTGEESTANFADTPIAHKSQDGSPVTVWALVRFRIDPEQLLEVNRASGKTMKEVVGKFVQSATREQTRNVLEATPIRPLYLGGMESTSKTIFDRLGPVLAARGVILESFNLTGVDPGEEYKTAIQQQQLQKEEASRQAEIVGVNKQVAEQKKVTAQGDAEAAVITANGQAEADRLRGQAARDFPELMQLEYYEALSTTNWAIFSPEDVQPTMPIPAPAAPAPTPPAP